MPLESESNPPPLSPWNEDAVSQPPTSNENSAKGEFQIGMKGMLAILLIVGSSVGLLGRLYLSNPEIALALLSFGSVAIPFMLAVFLLYRLAASSNSPAKIRAAASAILLAPIVGLFAAAVLSSWHYRRAGPAGLSTLTNKELLEKELPAKPDEPWVWDELEGRFAGGKLDAEEVNAALNELLNHMRTTKPNGYDSPLHWQRDFVAAASKSKLADPELLNDIYLAYFPKPKVEFDRIRVSDKYAMLETQFGSHWADDLDFPLTLVCDVAETRWDSERVSLEPESGFEALRRDRMNGPFELGQHTLEIDLRFGLVDRQGMVGVRSRALREKHWPSATKVWTTTIRKQIQVYADDDPVVKLREDIPLPNILVGRLLAQRTRQDRTQIKLVLEEFDAPTAVSYEVFAEAEGIPEIRIGSFSRFTHENGSSSSSGLAHTLREQLPPDIKRMSLRFVPYPQGLDCYPQVLEMHGTEFRIPKVTLDRLDLQ